MTAEPRFPAPATEQRDSAGPVGAPTGREAQDRADDAEDRRRQEELDYEELGGEA